KKFVSNKNKNIQIHPYRYKHVDSRTVNKFIKTYNENQTKYFFLHDQDSNNNCVLKLESELRNTYHITDKKLIVVKKEIESWYISGVTKLHSTKNMNYSELNYNKVNKISFEKIMQKSFKKPDCYGLACQNYDLKGARRRNDSLNYFLKRLEDII
ncbi:MAG: hypothetical protein L0H55_17035, partial [Candidatus Nitrosocosmicus sp.]|nr:hypothetical protein [Candidatus Nitrosocosmicus sp.]